jgi:prepilin-type N-terminal cleavage/methylation domain-containing protein
MPHRVRKSRARPRRRAGFTIVEVLVAVMILSVGVLGLAGAAAIVTRMMGSAEMQSDASTVAAARFESLRGTRCPLATGSATGAGINERWAVSQIGNPSYRMYEVVDSVAYQSRNGQRSQSYRSIVQCLP